MKALLMTLAVILGLLLCVAGIAGLLLTGFDLVYGGIALAVALFGLGLLAVFGRAIRQASQAEAEGAPGRRSRQKTAVGPNPLDKGQRL